MGLEKLDLIDELMGKRLFPDGEDTSVPADDLVVPVTPQATSIAEPPSSDPAPEYEFDVMPLIPEPPLGTGGPTG